MEKCFIAIDLKSFYASVECVERGLDPLTAKLVVADKSRTDKTICLAVSPALKTLGIPGRARLYEVYAKARNVDFVIAPPRMRKYMEISTKIFGIYASYVAAEDIHVYSIDEVFIDATHYLKSYGINAREFAMLMIRDVLRQTGITATAGIGTNMYLAKIAMDIKAKHMPADQDGVRIAELNEKNYRKELWNHTPITDFWRIGRGYRDRLAKLGIHSMGELARYSLTGYENLYKTFGINAELLIDHAWGYEPVEMKEVKEYRSENHSLSSGQVLSRPYSFDEAYTIVGEMADNLALNLAEKNLSTDQIVITVIYDVSNMKKYKGATNKDFYGRTLPKNAHGSINLGGFTGSSKRIIDNSLALFKKICSPSMTVRKIYIEANHVKIKNRALNYGRQLDLFTNYENEAVSEEKEERRQHAILAIKKRYGRNAILKGLNFEKGATMRERNNQVGGHRA